MSVYDFIATALRTQIPTHREPRVTRALWQLARQPTVPIAIAKDGDMLDVNGRPYRVTEKRANQREPLGGFATPQKDTIYLTDFSPAYRNDDSKLLASIIAHEQTHVDGGNEADAYGAELENLKRMAYPNTRHLKAVERKRDIERRLLEYLAEKEQRAQPKPHDQQAANVRQAILRRISESR